MANKFKVNAPNDENKVEMVGLDEIFNTAIVAENIICRYEKFAEDVILSCTMPEIPRYVLTDKEKPGMIFRAEDALQGLLVRYRKIVTWMRHNGIDVESVAGGGVENEKKKS